MDSDLYHFVGGDLSLAANGDLLLAAGDTLVEQRVLRRLLTNAGDYIWHLTYGAGLGAMVGSPANAAAIEAAIRSQIFQESSVAQQPAPVVTTQVNADGSVVCGITYADATTGETNVLTFPIGP